MPEPKKFTITFYGGVDTVTGANFLLETNDLGTECPSGHSVPKSTKILVDCGMFQGPKVADDPNYHPFPYNPAEVKALFITHAHLDHIGRIPKLVHDGFRGVIYSTPPTKEISKLSLEDSLGVLGKEVHGTDQPLLYHQADIDLAMSLWQTRDYHEEISVGEFKVKLLDAGHILGSAMYQFDLETESPSGRDSVSKSCKIVFTGDLGNSPAPLLRDTESITGANYLVMESVYGDRNHDDRAARLEKLEDVIESTIHHDGTLIIPAFSIERTQEMLYEIERMMETSKIPLVPVYLDSPLAIKVTEVYKEYSRYLNRGTEPSLSGQGGIFSFPQLRPTLSTEESRAIDAATSRKIIIAGSGMSNGGRVIHHEKRYLSDPKNALLLVGYQVAGSLGRQLLDGAKTVRILGDEIPVRARVVNLSGYSAHKDSQGLFEFVRGAAASLRRVFVVMGEPKSSLYLTQKLRDYLGLEAGTPRPGETVTITC